MLDQGKQFDVLFHVPVPLLDARPQMQKVALLNFLNTVFGKLVARPRTYNLMDFPPSFFLLLIELLDQLIELFWPFFLVLAQPRVPALADLRVGFRN